MIDRNNPIVFTYDSGNVPFSSSYQDSHSKWPGTCNPSSTNTSSFELYMSRQWLCGMEPFAVNLEK